MPQPDLAEFDLTVQEVLTRDIETDEVDTEFHVESENMDLPCAGDTAVEALEVFVACLSGDGDEVTVEELDQND